jgi:fructose-bisphosphate aldolase class II
MKTKLVEHLISAKEQRIAIGAFNIFNELTARAAIRAAESLNRPVILQTSVSTVRQYGAQALISLLGNLRGKARVPVIIHLDHCTDPELAAECAEAGWNSVMIDASHETIEENIRITREVVMRVRPFDVCVEGEIGVISGVEEDIVATTGVQAGIEETLRYIAETGIDAVAPAIGTAHGVYSGVPNLNFGLVESLGARTDCPVVIHGGTGLSAEAFRRLVSLGAAKINVSTAIKQAYFDAARQYLKSNPEDANPLKLDQSIEAAVTATVRAHLIMFDARQSISVSA